MSKTCYQPISYSQIREDNEVVRQQVRLHLVLVKLYRIH